MKYGLCHDMFVSWNRQGLDLLKICDKKVNGYLVSIGILNVSKYGEVVTMLFSHLISNKKMFKH